MASAAFFPFCAALQGRYPANALSTVIYVGCILVYQSAALVNWVLARRMGALAAELSGEDYRKTRFRLVRGCLVFALLFVSALVKVLGA
jgi:hypothetical protein